MALMIYTQIDSELNIDMIYRTLTSK